MGELADERADFGFETTLSGRTYVKLLTYMGGQLVVRHKRLYQRIEPQTELENGKID